MTTLTNTPALLVSTLASTAVVHFAALQKLGDDVREVVIFSMPESREFVLTQCDYTPGHEDDASFSEDQSYYHLHHAYHGALNNSLCVPI